ncbi:zinc finger BED domain-containing protein RICESLEEPER 2-like protein [Tanacetum coccineum]
MESHGSGFSIIQLPYQKLVKLQIQIPLLQVIDHNYRSYFRNEFKDDGEGSTRSRKKKKNDRILGAPEDDDWEYASRLKTNIESGFGKYMEKQEGMRNTEVDIYLRDGTERRDEKFDVLGWWKQNSEKFHVLSQVARHVLAMLVSTVASESAFSTGGRVIDKFRSSFTPKPWKV